MKKTVKSERPGWVSGTEYAALRDRSVGWVTKQVASGMPHEGGRRNGRPLSIPIVAAMEWESARKAGRLPAQSTNDEELTYRLAFYVGLNSLFEQAAFASTIEKVGREAGLAVKAARELPIRVRCALQQHFIKHGPPL